MKDTLLRLAAVNLILWAASMLIGTPQSINTFYIVSNLYFAAYLLRVRG